MGWEVVTSLYLCQELGQHAASSPTAALAGYMPVLLAGAEATVIRRASQLCNCSCHFLQSFRVNVQLKTRSGTQKSQGPQENDIHENDAHFARPQMRRRYNMQSQLCPLRCRDLATTHTC